MEIIGEAKTQLKKRDIDKVFENLNVIRPHIKKDIYPICVTYQTSPTVQEYAHTRGLTLFFSYELD